LSTAVELYRTDFLTGFSLSGCSDFDTWQTYQTEHLRQRLAAALDRLVEIYQSLSDYETALTYARRRLTLDPLHEPAHRALMMLYAISDQPSAALRQYAQCHDTLSTELDLAPGVETTALYHRIRSGDFQQVTVGDASPPIDKLPLLLPKSARSPVRHNLPPEPTPFIGRQDELNTLDTLLATPEVRLITIAGAGGTGKTRLALAAAQRQVNQANFAHGIYFISLARLSDPDLIVPAIAEALNFTFYEKVAPRQQLLNYLGQKKMLLILDNFEHLLGIADSGEPVGVDLVKAVLQHAPQVKLLITSRERLHLRQEQLYPIHGLTFSDQITAEAVISSDAVSLFLQCARRIRPELRVEADDLTDLIDICRLVEGMPLGLELAAAWVDLLSLADIATEIQESLDFLISDDHDRPDRHRSMRAVFDTTWQRLTEVEQQVLVQLSIFRGGFTRAAAQAVMGSSLATLAALTNKSLLHYHRSRDRYEIHALLRQYGEEKLTLASTSEKAAYDRHCAYYCSQLHQLESELKGSRRPRAIKEIEADIQNIRVAWQWASNQGQVERLHEALESLNRFYEWQGMDQEGEAVCFHTTKNLASITTPISLRLSAQLFAWQGVFY
jgi:predicted ATPase